MNARYKLVSGFASLAAVGAFAFLHVDGRQNMTEAVGQPFAVASQAAVVPLNSAETPQELTWDMSYGQLVPPEAIQVGVLESHG